VACAAERAFVVGGRSLCAEPEPLSWPEAAARCQSAGARLVFIDSMEENDALLAALASPLGHLDNIWLGLALDDDDSWRWGDGSPLGPAAWAPGEPNNSGGAERCGMLYGASGLWNDQPCEDAMGFLCSVPDRAAVPAGRGNFRPFLCPGRTMKLDGIEVCYHEQPLGWQAARVACTSAGGALLTLPTRARQQALLDAVWPHTRSARVWIGYTDKGHEGDWRKTTGAAASFALWRDGEPNNFGNGEDCAEWSALDGRWNDLPCGDRMPSLCEPNDG
jgi:hypothetical protein